MTLVRSLIRPSRLLCWFSWLSVVAQSCRKVDEVYLHCLSSDSTVSVSCPTNYNFLLRTAFIYRSAGAECPPTFGSALPPSDACLHTEITGRFATVCTSSSPSCRVFVRRPTSPASCDSQRYPGNYFVLLTYRCQPVFSTNENTTAWAISITSSTLRTSSFVRVASDLFSGFTRTTLNYCSIHIPAYHQAIVVPFLFQKSHPTTPCSQHIQVSRWNSSERFQICSKSAPPVTLGCDAVHQYYELRYVTDDTSVGSIFLINIQVHHSARLSVQCGTPPVPLYNLTAPPTTTTSTTSTTSSLTTSPAAKTKPATSTVRSHSIAGSTSKGRQPVTATTTTTTTTSTPRSRSTSATRSSTSSTSDPAVNASGGEKVGGRLLSTGALIGVIVGCVIVAIIIVSAVVIVICIRWRRAKLQPETETSPVRVQAAFRPDDEQTSVRYTIDPKKDSDKYLPVTEFYLDGDQTSKLVLDKRQTPSIFKNVLET